MPLTFYFDFALNLSAGRKSGGEADPKRGSRVNKQTVQSFLTSISDQVFTCARRDFTRARAVERTAAGRIRSKSVCASTAQGGNPGRSEDLKLNTGGEGGIRTPDTR